LCPAKPSWRGLYAVRLGECDEVLNGGQRQVGIILVDFL
jgi:hypothetical protein